MEVIRILVRSETQCCVKKFKGVNGRTTRTNETVCSPDMRQSLWTTTEATRMIRLIKAMVKGVM